MKGNGILPRTIEAYITNARPLVDRRNSHIGRELGRRWQKINITFAVTANQPKRLPKKNLGGIRREFILPRSIWEYFSKRKTQRPTRDHISVEELVRAAAN